jgi:hypothetical protein
LTGFFFFINEICFLYGNLWFRRLKSMKTRWLISFIVAICISSNSMAQAHAYERWKQSILQLNQQGIDSIFVFWETNPNIRQEILNAVPIIDYIPVNHIPREIGDTTRYTEPDSIDMIYAREGCSSAHYVFFKKNNQLFLLRFDDCYIYDTLELKEEKLVNNLFKYKEIQQEKFKHSRNYWMLPRPTHSDGSYTLQWFVNSKTYLREVDFHEMGRESDWSNKAIMQYNAKLMTSVLIRQINTLFKRDEQQHLFRELKQITTERRIKNPYKKQP